MTAMVLARLEPWHWWIGVVFVVLTVVTVIALAGNYVNKVVRPTYPDKRQRSDS